MVLKCLGSSSDGNCYLLTASDGSTLIIECGVQFTQVKKALHWSLGGVVGCLVSHRHKDHSKYIKDVLSCGITTLALEDVFESAQLRNRVCCKSIEPLHGYVIGDFKVFTLPMCHDVPCLAFIIEHREMGRLLFITDTMMCEYKLPKMQHIMIEANYSDAILQVNIDSGVVPASMKDRLLHSHLELKTTCGILTANDLSDVNEVILLHLSGNNSSKSQFIETVERCSGKTTYVAESGFETTLSINPY